MDYMPTQSALYSMDEPTNKTNMFLLREFAVVNALIYSGGNQLKWKSEESKCCDCLSCINMSWWALGFKNVYVGLIIPEWILYDRIFGLFFVMNHSL